MFQYVLCCIFSSIFQVSGQVGFNKQIVFQDHSALRACQQLASYYPDQTLLTTDPQYPLHQSKYWAVQQSDLKPQCRFLPSNTYDVSVVLETCYAHNASFAISSGGHSSNIGFSNVNGGVTIDLSDLKQIQLSDDRESVWMGPGSTWSDVYRALEPERVTVAGARVSHVGAGGFVLGGGISWYANQEGFSCDSVLAFEVVTPDLQTRHVDRQDHPQLFWALKGTAGTLGVVTGIQMRAIAISQIAPLYAGAIAFEEDQLSQALSALAKTSTHAMDDEYTSSYLSFGYLPAEKKFVYNAYIVNTEGHDDSRHMKDWHSFPSTHSSLRHTTITDSADEISASNTLGLRRSKFTFTTSPQLEKITPLHTLFRNFAANLDLDDDGLVGMNFQPLTTRMLNMSASSSNPNVFSETLIQDMVPLLVVSVELWWSDSSKDTEFEGSMREFERQMLGPSGVGWAKHVWVYPNYAAKWQDVFAEERLGKKTVERARAVKKLYDPEGVWERLRPRMWSV